MNDAGQLGAIQRTPRIQTNQDRCRGFLLLTKKTILVGQGQMHPCTLHRRERLNGAGQLPFQPPLKRQTLLKLRHAEAVAIHAFKTGHRALGQPQGGQPQAGVINLVSRHQNGAATIGVLIRNIHGR